MADAKKSKYETDPLDPEFVRRTEETSGRTSSITEEPTRRFDEQQSPTSYPSVFVPPVYQQPPANYTTFGTSAPPASPPVGQNPPSDRAVTKLGLPENIASVLPYAPFYVGLIASIIELLIVPRGEVRVRLHAAQGLALQLGIIVISFFFQIVGSLTDTSFGGFLFWLASTIFLIVSMTRVWKGKEHHIAALGEATAWINQKFEPRN